MPTVLVTTRLVTQLECPWLDADIPAGTTVWSFDGHDYGCITPYGVAVTAKAAETPFFELPANAVKDGNG